MQTFLNWIKEQKLEAQVDTDSAAAEKVETESEPTTGENRVRTGYSANYPPAYVSGQYPHHYFNPSKATADLDKENMDKKNVKAPKN
jgi:hypothetical protein